MLLPRLVMDIAGWEGEKLSQRLHKYPFHTARQVRVCNWVACIAHRDENAAKYQQLKRQYE